MNTRDVARAYAERGWSTVPIALREKGPRSPGWQNLRIKPEDVDKLFAEHCNIGVLLGEASDGLCDIDLDCDEAVAAARAIAPGAVAFGRAGSRRSHLLFVAPSTKTERFNDPRTNAVLCELRSTGCQTVFPGSTHPSGEAIEWEPGGDEPQRMDAADLRRLAVRIAVASLVRRYSPLAADDDISSLPPDVAVRCATWLGVELAAEQPKEHKPFASRAADYNASNTPDWGAPGSGKCHICGHNDCFGRMPEAPDRWWCWSASHPADSGVAGRNGGRHGDALDYYAWLDGCSPGEYLDALDAQQRVAPAVAAEPVKQEHAQVKIFRRALCSFTLDELRRAPPEQRYILHPYLPESTVAVLAGPGQSNKTTLTVYLAVARALGLPFYGGNVPSKGKTIIFSTEDSRDDYWRKIASIRHALGDRFDDEAVRAGIAVLDCAGIPVRMVEMSGGQFRPTMMPEHLAEAVAADAPDADLVILETVSRLAGGIETNESLSILVESAQRLCKLSKLAVLLVCHVSQEAARSGVADAYAPRGGSALGDNARSTMVLTPITKANASAYLPEGTDYCHADHKGLRVLVHAKCNGALPAEPMLLERLSTPYGPILTEAELVAREKPKPGAKVDSLVELLRGLSGSGIDLSRTTLLPYCQRLGVKQRDAVLLVNEAIAAGRVSEVPARGRRGCILVAT